MPGLWGAITFVYGLLLGSFFNVLIWRIPRDESIIRPGSHCPGCGKPIRAWQNIPIISYLLLGGKCGNCKVPISIRYPLIEAATALAAVALCHGMVMPLVGQGIQWWRWIVVVARGLSLLLLIPILVIDLDHFIIPNRFTIPGLVTGLALSFLPADLTPLQSLLGALAGGGTLYAIGLIGTVILKKGEAMGLGDVKLMAFLGALLGWKIALMSIVFASFIGSIAGGILLLTRKLNSDHRIPFGPYLAAGTWAAVFAGEWLVSWYMTTLDALFFR